MGRKVLLTTLHDHVASIGTLSTEELNLSTHKLEINPQVIGG